MSYFSTGSSLTKTIERVVLPQPISPESMGAPLSHPGGIDKTGQPLFMAIREVVKVRVRDTFKWEPVKFPVIQVHLSPVKIALI
jgi:hypothetical protein